MRKNFGELQSYIMRMLKGTAALEIDNELLKDFINEAYLETAAKGRWKQSEASVASATLVAGTSEYSPADLGITDFIRPCLPLLWNGDELPEMSFEDQAYYEYRETSNASGTPVYHTWQSGNLRLIPAPDASAVASAATLRVLYTAYPAALSGDTDALDAKFRTHWQEILAWGVLYRKMQGMKAEDQIKLPVAWQRVEQEWKQGLENIYKEIWSQPTRKFSVKDRGSELDANDADDNFYLGV